MTCIRFHFRFSHTFSYLPSHCSATESPNFIIEFGFVGLSALLSRTLFCFHFGLASTELNRFWVAHSVLDSILLKNSNSIKYITRSIQANYTLEPIHMHLENWLRTVDKNMRCEVSNVNKHQGKQREKKWKQIQIKNRVGNSRHPIWYWKRTANGKSGKNEVNLWFILRISKKNEFFLVFANFWQLQL